VFLAGYGAIARVFVVVSYRSKWK